MEKTQTSLFNYKLPPKAIAQRPRYKRGQSNLLILHKDSENIEYKKYFDVVNYINPNDIVILNNTKVIYARLFATPNGKTTKVEVLLLNPLPNPQNISSKTWEVLIGGARKVKNTHQLNFNQHLHAKFINKTEKQTYILRFNTPPINLLNIYGHTPLPKYIKRKDEEIDKSRYQTVFAKIKGSVAAPTASLNLTKQIIREIEKKGAKIVYITLYVGWGTFAPIKTKYIEDFHIHTEFVEIPTISANTIQAQIEKRKQEPNFNGKIIAFGTTVVRALEGVYHSNQCIKPYQGLVDIYIYPPFNFKVIDKLITNFHTNKSSLITLVSAFAGREKILNAYHEALNHDYEFLSYGDSMIIL